MAIISREYEEFLREEEIFKKLSFYEKACKFAERFKISPFQSLNRQLQEAIDFSHLKVTPKGAFSLAVVATMLFFWIPLFTMIIFGLLSFPMIFLLVFLCTMLAYFLFTYPTRYAVRFRIKASSEMILATIYMTIAMKVRPNLEYAIKYAADNLTGPLAYDLKRVMWDVYVRRFESMDEAVDSFANKWKRENEEFTQAISLIKTAFHESAVKRDKMLDEAVTVMFEGTKERMKYYARDLRTPVTVVNALGFLLPIIGLIFLPIMSLFLPEIFRASFLVIGYCIILPVTVYWLMNTALEKRPYTFHQPDLSKHPQLRSEKRGFIILSSTLIPLLLVGFGIYKIATSAEVFSLSKLLYSLLITFGITLGIVTYCILSTFKKLKLREEIVQIERELAETLFLLGHQLGRGIPIENALKEINPKIKDLKISRMFDMIVYNIETFGMTFEQAIFNKTQGAINFFPSTLISAVLRAVTEISKGGMAVLSGAMVSISTYLKDMHQVEENLYEILDETTSSMELQALLLAPLASGVVVALSSIVMKMLLAFKSVLENFQMEMGEGGAFGAAGSTVLSSILNINKMMPVSTFQLVVGIYMIEVVGTLVISLSTIRYGEETLMKRLNLGKKLLMSFVIYSIVMIVLYSILNAVMPIGGLIG